MAESTPKDKSPVLGWAKKIVPVVVSLLILYYYFRDQEWDKLIDACRGANLWLAVLAIVIPQVAYWFLDSLMTERTFKWFHGPFPLWTYFWVKGAIYILMFINTALGGGGMLLYQQRKAEITWRKFMGVLLFRLGVGAWGMGIIMVPFTLALYYYDLDEKIKINMYVWWGFLIFGIYWFIEGWLVWHHNMSFGISKLIVRDRDSEFWSCFRIAKKKHWLLLWAMILPPYFMMLVGFYFLTFAFGVEVPFLEFMVVSPIVLAIMDLPIAFAGFGTATVAWTLFFGAYGTVESIAALTLFLPFARAICRSLIGLVSLPMALKEINAITQPSQDEPEGVINEEEKT